MKKRMLALAATSLLAIGMATAAKADSVQLPGSGDPFVLNFNENGHGSYSLNGGPLVSDPGFIDSNGFLAYSLPETVVHGDVVIADPNGTTISDGLRFLANPNPGSGGDVMEFYSTDKLGTLADTGLPVGFTTTFVGAVENANGSFTYSPGGNVYNGLSDAPGPVPGAGLAGLAALALAGLYARTRRA